MAKRDTYSYRSLFWPIVLLGVGLLWLLANLGLLPGVTAGLLWRFWPLLLIGVGLDMIFGRRSRLVGALIGLALVGSVVALLVLGPSAGLTSGGEVRTERFSEPVGGAARGEVELHLSIGRARIVALEDSAQLIDAEITHVGEIQFQAEGERDKKITLRQREVPVTPGWFDLLSDQDLRWEIGLSPNLPLALDLHGGVGEASVDLRALDLTALRVDVGVGEIEARLPAVGELYTARVRGGVGKIRLEVAQGASLDLEIEGGVGDVSVQIPEGTAVRLEAETGLGHIDVPSGLIQVSGGGTGFVGDRGVWESEGYRPGGRRILILFDGGVGDLTVRFGG
jgi:hypothetical protein